MSEFTRYEATRFSRVQEDAYRRDQWVTYAVQFMRVQIARFPLIRFTEEDMVLAMKAQRDPLPDETAWIKGAMLRAKREGLITDINGGSDAESVYYETTRARSGINAVVWHAA